MQQKKVRDRIAWSSEQCPNLLCGGALVVVVVWLRQVRFTPL